MKRLFLVGMMALISVGQAAEKYAVLIGINDYQSSKIQDLRYSEADAKYLNDVLFRYARFKPQNIRTLIGEEASYANIKRDIYWLGEVAKPEDEVFFYFSGHGTRLEDADGNEEDGMDEAFCPYETDLNNKASVILDDEIGHWFERIKAEKVVVVLDCCHSGGAAGRSLEQDGSKGLEMDIPTSGARSLNTFDMNPYAKDMSVENKFIMTASDAEEQSYENPQLGHGVFTYYLGEAIRGKADRNDDDEVTTDEMYDYTRTRTLEFAKSIKRKQNPVKFGSLDIVMTNINKQLSGIIYFDGNEGAVDITTGKGFVSSGDIFVVRKTDTNPQRDLTVEDDKVLKIEIVNVYSDYSEAKVVESYYENLQITPEEYTSYYAEKVNFGSISVMTEPWTTVLLEGKPVGTTPVTITDIPEGDYEVSFKISLMGYPEIVQKTVHIQANRESRLVETFEKVPAVSAE